MTEGLIVENRGRVLQVTLATGDGRNEMTDAMLVALTKLFQEPTTGTVAIVINSAGADFCAGRAPSLPPPVPEGADMREVLMKHVAAPILALYDAIHRANVPVACFVNGLASGMGCAIVAACDYAVAASDSRYDAPELDKQFAPGLLMSALSQRIHPKAVARLVLSMRTVDAATALSMGLVGEVVAANTLDSVRQEFVALMNSRAPLALIGIKRYLREAGDLQRDARAALAAEVTAESVASRSSPFKPVAPPNTIAHAVIGAEEIAYVDIGDGPPLVLLHSLGTSNQMWQAVLPQLASQYRVIALDARGHGASTNRGGYRPDEVARDVVALADRLGLRRFAVLGISMGGLTAVRVAASLGRRVAALVLSSTYASVAGPQAELRIANAERTLERMPMAGFARTYVEQTLSRDTSYEAREAIAGQIATMSRTDYLDTLKAIGRDDVSPFLSAIESPCLVLTAEFDLSVPKAVSHRLAEGIHGAIETGINGAGHLACVDAPQAYAAAVTTYLESVGDSSWNS
jgi:pimeloyl-ACP methyl ester carboxylesterase/enoyl-CoA hydratase/carnithine racemase